MKIEAESILCLMMCPMSQAPIVFFTWMEAASGWQVGCLQDLSAHSLINRLTLVEAQAAGNEFIFYHLRLDANLSGCSHFNSTSHGALAQLVERLVRNEKVSGSNPLCSTSMKE